MDFLRYCEIIIGPLADWQGGGSINEAVRIIADGTNRNLRAAFNVRKSLTGEPNKIDVAVWGLSRETMLAVRGNLSRIQIIAGYESSPDSASLVAAGGILSAVPERQGADIVLKLQALDGYGGMVRGSYSRYFDGRTPVNQVVQDLAASLPGVTVGQVDVDGQLFAKGQQFSGSTTAQLNKMADQFGFSWSVQNGVFQAVQDSRDTGRIFSFTSDRNLINAQPLLNGPTAQNVGVEIVAKFEPRMNPGDRMIVESSVNPLLSGTYKATSIDLAFDSHGPASFKAQSLRNQ